jgi:predicted transposase/invertase (TIGR01784 family)
MSEISNPHDKFFKESFSRIEVATDFFRHHLPQPISQQLNLNTLTLQAGSFVAEELQEQFADLLYTVQFNDNPQESAYLYLLLEHKSYPDQYTPLQLLRYMVRIWERDLREHEPLRPIVPLLVYHGQDPWQLPLNMGGLFRGDESLRRYWPHFDYILRDISHLSDADLVGSAHLQIALYTMKYVGSPLLGEYLHHILPLFQELKNSQSSLEYLRTTLYYIGNAARHLSRPAMVKIVQQHLAQEENEVMQTIAESWIEEGRQTGLQVGLQKGKVIGLQRAVLSLLEIRFGLVAEEIEMQIRDIADAEELEQLLRTAATAVSFTEFCQQLPAPPTP